MNYSEEIKELVCGFIIGLIEFAIALLIGFGILTLAAKCSQHNAQQQATTVKNDSTHIQTKRDGIDNMLENPFLPRIIDPNTSMNDKLMYILVYSD